MFINRTGLARIGSIFFLIITLSQQILTTKNVCEQQKNFDFKLVDQDDAKVWVIFHYIFINKSMKKFFQKQCWESYVGSQLYKLIIVDFFLQIGWPFLELTGKILAKLTKIEFFRQIFDLESKFIDLVATQMVLNR